MINGTTGRSIFLYALFAFVVLILANVVLTAMHLVAPETLANAVNILAGLLIGAAGINPASKPPTGEA